MSWFYRQRLEVAGELLRSWKREVPERFAAFHARLRELKIGHRRLQRAWVPRAAEVRDLEDDVRELHEAAEALDELIVATDRLGAERAELIEAAEVPGTREVHGWTSELRRWGAALDTLGEDTIDLTRIRQGEQAVDGWLGCIRSARRGLASVVRAEGLITEVEGRDDLDVERDLADARRSLSAAAAQLRRNPRSPEADVELDGLVARLADLVARPVSPAPPGVARALADLECARGWRDGVTLDRPSRERFNAAIGGLEGEFEELRRSRETEFELYEALAVRAVAVQAELTELARLEREERLERLDAEMVLVGSACVLESAHAERLSGLRALGVETPAEHKGLLVATDAARRMLREAAQSRLRALLVALEARLRPVAELSELLLREHAGQPSLQDVRAIAADLARVRRAQTVDDALAGLRRVPELAERVERIRAAAEQEVAERRLRRTGLEQRIDTLRSAAGASALPLAELGRFADRVAADEDVGPELTRFEERWVEAVRGRLEGLVTECAELLGTLAAVGAPGIPPAPADPEPGIVEAAQAAGAWAKHVWRLKETMAAEEQALEEAARDLAAELTESVEAPGVQAVLSLLSAAAWRREAVPARRLLALHAACQKARAIGDVRKVGLREYLDTRARLLKDLDRLVEDDLLQCDPRVRMRLEALVFGLPAAPAIPAAHDAQIAMATELLGRVERHGRRVAVRDLMDALEGIEAAIRTTRDLAWRGRASTAIKRIRAMDEMEFPNAATRRDVHEIRRITPASAQ